VSDSDYHQQIEAWRGERDRFFREHYASPLSDEAIEQFTGLDYFEVDESLVYAARFRAADLGRIAIDSSTGAVSDYRVAGIVEVPFSDGVASLIALLGEEGEAYIPFRDRTCGAESYGGGRYLSIESDEEGSCVVDFNRAINPYCAYDPEFSCPLPPPQNWLNRSISAGEKDYRSHEEPDVG
jgi:uncharacterized protein (DUF1684 family)